MNNIVVAKFTGEKYINVYDVYQWDYGQILRIEGLKLPKMVEVHFSLEETSGEALVRIGTTKDGVTDVTVPDGMLENEGVTGTYKIYAWVYIRDADSGSTEYKVTIHVKTRSKPEIPGGGDNQDAFNEAVLEVRKSAEKSEEAQKQAEGYAHGREDLPERAEDNAKYYSGKASEDAKKTAEDREAVGRLVESVSGIDEQVVKVEKLSKDAQEAATQAGTSAEQAELHKQDAETASSAAQTAAQETEADKVSVEKLSAQVQKNKESVDKTAQDFALNTQQALADVNNAGQAQTERVQTAGTTAVENIKTAQSVATQAVETAKAEAIKAVADKGKEVLEAIPNFDAKLDTKLDKNQGAEHAGKALVVGEDGNVVPGEVQTEGVGDAADAIVNTVSGMLLNIKDSAERKNKGFGMSGKTEQVQTTGVQLFDRNTVTEGILSETGDIATGAGFCTSDFIPVKSNENYYCTKTGSKRLKFFDINKRPIQTNNFSDAIVETGGTFTTGGTTKYIRLSTTIGMKEKLMLNSGTTERPYEPYTGGKPSPSPEYPQEIKNVGKWNPETQKYEVNIRITNAKESWDKEQTLTLTSDRPLTKWDRLTEQDGQIGWLYGSKKYIVTGDEGFIVGDEKYYTGDSTNMFFINSDFSEEAGFIDRLSYVPIIFANTTGAEGFCFNKRQLHMRFKNTLLGVENSATKEEKIEAYKIYLKKEYDAGTPYEILYKSSETEFVPLLQSEQEAIRALQTYYPTTVVSNSDDAEMQLTYVADTKNYTDNKIKEAVSAQTQSLANLLSLMPLSTQAAMIENDTNNILDNMEVEK